MSHAGKMSRGLFYLNHKNLPTNLQDDVNYYLEQSKPKPKVVKEEPKEDKIIKKVKEVKKVKKDDN